jgi:hypothetical protein
MPQILRIPASGLLCIALIATLSAQNSAPAAKSAPRSQTGYGSDQSGYNVSGAGAVGAYNGCA